MKQMNSVYAFSLLMLTTMVLLSSFSCKAKQQMVPVADTLDARNYIDSIAVEIFGVLGYKLWFQVDNSIVWNDQEAEIEHFITSMDSVFRSPYFEKLAEKDSYMYDSEVFQLRRDKYEEYLDQCQQDAKQKFLIELYKFNRVFLFEPPQYGNLYHRYRSDAGIFAFANNCYPLEKYTSHEGKLIFRRDLSGNGMTIYELHTSNDTIQYDLLTNTIMKVGDYYSSRRYFNLDGLNVRVHKNERWNIWGG